MPSIFDKISKALMGRGNNKQMPNPPSTFNADLLESAPEIIEDAMSIPSFRQVVGENEKKLKGLTEVHVEYLTNHLNKIHDDELKKNTADILLKELQGIYNHYKECGDKAVVSRIIQALQPFASSKINDAITYGRPFSIYPQKATELRKLYDENFLEAFRWDEKVEPQKEQQQNLVSKPRP